MAPALPGDRRKSFFNRVGAKINYMRPSSLFSLLIFLIVIIIIIGGIIIILGPVPPEPVCIVCGNGFLKTLGIDESVLGAISLGVVNKLRNVGEFK